MVFSPFDHPFFSKLLVDDTLQRLFSPQKELAAMVIFESSLAKAQAHFDLIPQSSADKICALCEGFKPDYDDLSQGALRDGTIAPALIAQLRDQLDSDDAQWLHFGASYQDVIDTGLSLRLAILLNHFSSQLEKAIEELEVRLTPKDDIFATGSTHVKQVLSVEVKCKISSWMNQLRRSLEKVNHVRQNLSYLHLAGSVGNNELLGEKGDDIRAHMAKNLGLYMPNPMRHGEREGGVELANWLVLVTGALGKMGQDIGLVTHQSNAVAAELLVVMARYNATLVGGMHQGMVHENERSDSTWALEWLCLPQMCAATGGALKLALLLLDGIEFIESDSLNDETDALIPVDALSEADAAEEKIGDLDEKGSLNDE